MPYRTDNSILVIEKLTLFSTNNTNGIKKT